jgi:hypothetical protein
MWLPATPVVDAATAVIIWGTNIAPYWELDRWYALEAVKSVLAAGKVTSVTPCTRPAALTVRFSKWLAIFTLLILGQPVATGTRPCRAWAKTLDSEHAQSLVQRSAPTLLFPA